MICKKKFANVRQNINDIHNPVPLKCDLNETQIKNKRNLKRHLNEVHFCKRPHTCTFCEKAFANKSNLIRHETNVHGAA